MTESEWLASDDPRVMLSYLCGTDWADTSHEWDVRISDRKLAMFAAGCAATGPNGAALYHEALDGWYTWAENPRRENFGMSATDGAHYWLGVKVGQHHAIKVDADAKRQRAGILRDIIGNPFRPVSLCGPIKGITQTEPVPGCSACNGILAWSDGTVRRMAQQMYDARNFDAMPILADALEYAGCTEAAILQHCRGTAPHVRGCWVIDLILGKR